MIFKPLNSTSKNFRL